MLKESFVVIALALVATLVGYAAADNRPVVQVEHDGLLFKVPVYEDVTFTKRKCELDARQFAILKAKLLEVTDLVIVKRKGYFSVASRAWGFIGLFNNFISASKQLVISGDPSPREKKSFGVEMSRLVEVILATKTYSSMSDRETYARVATVLNGIERLVQKSPVGLYMDWSQLTINGQSISQHIGPVIYWMHQNGYGLLLKVVSMVGGLFVKIGV